MRALLLVSLLLTASAVSAQVYRWVDGKGTVHYSNATPPAGVKATLIDPDAKAGPPSPESWECYTVRCQGERLEQRLARREELEVRLAAERAAATPKPPRGLEFRKYISIQRGMHEGELVTIAGSPDLLFWDARAVKTYTYLPTVADPFTTTITLIRGRISEIDRVRKF
ncbi:MAG: DUF4124 domain-containing protein [Burkholderiales bacterium]